MAAWPLCQKERMQSIMVDIKVVTWPRGEESLLVAVLADVLSGTGQDVLSADTIALRDDGADLPLVPAGHRLVVEYEEFPDAAALRFAAALAAGDETDGSAESFLRFASGDFSAFRDFMLIWADPDAPDQRIVVPRAALRADPGPWLAWASGALDPSLLLSGPALEQACAVALRLDQHLNQRQAADAIAPSVMAGLDNNHLDQIRRITIDREAVCTVFAEVLGRAPREEGILLFQAMASAEALRESLMASQEYRRRTTGVSS
jgi:hypothetical protein